MTIVYADTRDDSNPDWEAALAAKDGHPVLALIAMVVVLGIAGAFAYRTPGPHDIAMLLGGTIGLVLIVWGIAYAVTLRHATLVWRIATLVVLIALAALWMLGVLVGDTIVANRDMAMMAEMQVADDGTMILPADADRGPVSRIFIGYAADLNRVKRTQAETLHALGTQRIADPQALVYSPALLRDCERFARAKPGSAARFAKIRDRGARLAVDMQHVAIPPGMRNTIVASMKHHLPRDHGRLAKLAEITGAELDEAQAICTVLARHQWRARGNVFVFTSTRDRALYDQHITRWNDLSEQELEIYSASRAQVASGQKMMRESLR